MSIFFTDTWAGSGTADLHAPDLGLDGTTTWALALGAASLSAGTLTNAGARTAMARINYSPATPAANASPAFTCAFNFTTGPDVSLSASTVYGFRLRLMSEDDGITAYSAYVDLQAVGGAASWTLSVNDGSTTVAQDIAILANTTYAVSIADAPAGTSITMNGVTASMVMARPGVSGLSGLSLYLGGTSSMGPLEASTGSTYTAPETGSDFTFPMMTLDADFGISSDFNFQAITLAANLGGSSDFTFPAPALAANFGADLALTLPMMLPVLEGALTADFNLPMMTMQSDMGAGADLALPSLTLDAAVHDSSGENALDITLPMLTLQAGFGASFSATLPALTLDAAMTGVALITVDLTLPMLALDAQGTGSPYVVTADIALPMLALEAYFGAGCEFNLPMMTLDASMTAGGVLSCDFRLPMLTLDAQGTGQNRCWVDVTLPMLVPGISLTADLTLPRLRLDAQITAVVTVSYEAYAINLKHTMRPGDNTPPADEVTRYTNFPFTQIVRYKNSYFGVAADGLYLLEGTTDYAVPPTVIPWAFKTTTTDFGSVFQKTVVSAYFGGRMGPSSTITLTAGEGIGVPYSFTTSRGALAQNYRQLFGRGVKSRYYAIGAAGADELALDDIELNVATLSRRI